MTLEQPVQSTPNENASKHMKLGALVVLVAVTLLAWGLFRSCDSESDLQREKDQALFNQLAGTWIRNDSGLFGNLASAFVITPEGQFRIGIDRAGSSWIYGQTGDFFSETSGEQHIAGTCSVRDGKLVVTVSAIAWSGMPLVKGDMRELPVLRVSEAELELGGAELAGTYRRRR